MSSWEPFIESTPDRSYAALPKGKSDDGANNDSTDATKRDAFKKHAVAKKCHRCHLFHEKDLLQIDNRFCITPKPFNPIILTLFRGEYMDDNITEVQEQPACFSNPLLM